MTFWVAGAVVGSALIGGSAAKSAASTQSAAADRAAELQNQQFQQTREDYAPYREAGYNALAQLQKTAGNVPGAFKFGAGDYQADPGYAFRLSEGQKALDRQAAARGGLISGGALKAAQRYGQEMGSQEFGNAYNRALTSYNTGVSSENQLYNRQAALAGIGQTATGQVAQAGQNYANTAGNLMTGGAAAQAAGQVGMANAITGGLGTYLNYSQGNALTNALRGYGGTSNASAVTNPYFAPGAGTGGI
jgi:hypothetical protein